METRATVSATPLAWLEKKKAVGDKEHMGNFRAGTHKVEGISTGQNFHTLSDESIYGQILSK